MGVKKEGLSWASLSNSTHSAVGKLTPLNINLDVHIYWTCFHPQLHTAKDNWSGPLWCLISCTSRSRYQPCITRDHDTNIATRLLFRLFVLRRTRAALPPQSYTPTNTSPTRETQLPTSSRHHPHLHSAAYPSPVHWSNFPCCRGWASIARPKRHLDLHS